MTIVDLGKLYLTVYLKVLHTRLFLYKDNVLVELALVEPTLYLCTCRLSNHPGRKYCPNIQPIKKQASSATCVEDVSKQHTMGDKAVIKIRFQ